MMNAISGQEHAGFSCADMLRGVLVIATVDASGRFHPFTGSAIDALERKLKAVREAQERIHTVALAEGQRGFAPGQPGDDAHGWPFAIVHARDFDDLTRQLVRQGGLLGQRLRQHARDATLELLLFGKRSARWNDLFQEPRLKKLEPRKHDKEEHASRDGHVDAAVGWMRHENITLAETDTQTLPELLRLARSSHSPLRGVIIGPPGAGKSTLLRYAARLLADDAEAERLPLLIHLPRWHSEADGRDWRAALLQHACNMLEIPPQGGEARALRQMLKVGRLLVLLDGLDEVNASFIETHVLSLVEHLDTTGASWLATCRTAARQHWEGLTGPLQADAELRAPLWRLDELDANARKRYITHWPWQHEERERRQQALQEAIRTSPQVADLARNPQLLSLLCYVADTVPELPLPPTRVEIFEHAVAHALNASLPARPGVEGAEDATPEDRLALLGEITLQLALHEGRPVEFSWQTIIRCVKVLRKEAGSNADLEFRLPACLLSRQGLERFLDELVERGLLLRHQTARETRFAFLHLSLQEFLTASALALRIDDAGLEQELKADCETKLLGEWLRCWHGEERWRETLLMLAGCLQDPKPLLELFADPARDTLFRDFLATAGLMTAEISALQYEQDDALRRQASRILDDVRDIWLMSLGAVRKMLDASLTVVLKRPEGNTHDDTFVTVSLDMLRNEHWQMRHIALKVLTRLDPSVQTSIAEKHIVPLLLDKDWQVRDTALEVLGKLDPAVLASITEEHILPMLREDWQVRGTVVEVLGKLDPDELASIAEEHILPMLREEDGGVRRTAIEVLGMLDPDNAKSVLPDIVACMEQELYKGVETISAIYNHRIPIDRFWPPVVKALQGGASERRIAIMKGLATLRLAADRPPITTVLEELARDDGEDADVHQAAQEALAKIRRRPEFPAA